MTTRDTPFAAGTPCWVDLLSSDPDRTKAFYGTLFGWTSEDGGEEYGGYITFSSGGLPVAGMVPNTGAMGSPDGWTTYFATDDIDVTVAAAAGAGATVMVPAMQVHEQGAMAVLVDPVGAVFGLWRSGAHTGFRVYNEPGSVTWDEHHSRDFAVSTDFYTSVFGWGVVKTSDTDDFRYYEGQIDGQTVAGLMDSASFLPEGVPSHWAVYFNVADADASIATALDNGATVIRPAEDTPFGRIADLVDPTGAMFKLHSTTMSDGSNLA